MSFAFAASFAAAGLFVAELNESAELDIGNPGELGMQHAQLKKRHSQINVMGGCCGTDHRHVEQIAQACAAL